MASLIDWKGGLITSACVGSLLTVINQWAALFDDKPFVWGAVALTYLVPFCVYQLGRLKQNMQGGEGECTQTSVQQTQKPELKSHINTLRELGRTVSSVARKVNQASKTRIEMARESKDRATWVKNEAHEIADAATSSAELAHALASTYRNVHTQLTDLIQLIYDADVWSRTLTDKTQTFSAEFQQINDIVATITRISSNTNLLALNAAIESARAGDAGKGFAVVANEVKKLANDAGENAEQINQQVDGLAKFQGEILQGAVSFSEKISEKLKETAESEHGLNNLAAKLSELIESLEKQVQLIQVKTSAQIDASDDIVSRLSKVEEGAYAALEGSKKNISVGEKILSESECMDHLTSD